MANRRRLNYSRLKEVGPNGDDIRALMGFAQDKYGSDEVFAYDGVRVYDELNDTIVSLYEHGAFIAPRLTTTQRNALTAVNGMIIYNTSTTAFNFYENGAWVTKVNA